MGLALFDALFFPVLVSNSAILAAFLFGGMGVSEAIILTVIIGGLLDFFLVRCAWRKANAGPELPQELAPETKTDAKAQQTQTPQATPIDEQEAARRQVHGPAVGLLIVGLVGGLTFAARCLLMMWLHSHTFPDTSPVWILVQFLEIARVLDPFKGLLLIVAALPMLWMRAYWLAVAASIVAMLPVGPSFLAGVPIGIWALAVLTKPEVKAAFAVTKNRLESKAAEL